MKERSVILLLSVFVCTFSNIFAYTESDPSSHAYSNGTCKKYYWACKDGACIDELRKCDGHEDCDDGSDEEECFSYCNLDLQYQCVSGECIDREMVCDGANDCFSESDEENCNIENTDKACHDDWFRCDNGRCIPPKWVCDGRSDCKGGKDEKNCSKPCPRGYSPCNSSECIPLAEVCDGTENCVDGEDEKGCSENTSMCSTERGLYLCKDKSKCLKSEWVCDSSPHCDDGSDENADCGKHCTGSQIHCGHNCFRTPDGPRCTCNTGYKLARDNSTCEDINECAIENQVCDHFCQNTMGSFLCSCGDGYRMLDDGATCRIQEPALLLFSVGNNVEAKLLDNSRSWIVSKGSKEAFGVALDPVKNNVYWIENRERVLFKHLNKAEEPKVFIHQGLELPENLVIDWFGRNIYVADYKRNQILACNLESEDCVPILEKLEKPRALQLDLHNRYLYWTAIKSHTIERAGLDGSERKTVIRENIVWPNGLAIDHPASRIYWADARLNKIDSCNLDGHQRKSLSHEDADHAYSLAVWQDRIYWTEWQKEEDLHMEIHSCRKRDGKLWRSEYKDEKRAVNNIAIYHQSMFSNSVNPCLRPFGTKCSHLCLLSPSEEKGYVCACPIEMSLDQYGHTCHEKESKIPLVAVQSKLYGVPLRHYGNSNPQLRKYARLDLGVVADMDYNPSSEIVYFADPRNELISSVNLSSRKVERVIENIRRPISVAIDWLRDNLYWINGLHHTVEVSRSSGHFRQTAIKHFQNPTDLALDVISGYLFVSVASVAPSIMKCNLNGSMCTILAHKEIENPSSIFLDVTVQPKMLYWTDSEKNTIEAIGVDGSNQHVVFKDLKHPMKVHVDDEHILWSEMRSTFLYVAEKDVNGVVKKINMELENIPVGEWFLTLTMVGGPKITAKTNPCFGSQKCHQLCFSKTEHERVCSCTHGLELTEDGSTCVYEKCPFNEVQCQNKACIPQMYWCDGTADCEDFSDEANCSFIKPCTKDEFQCKDGRCISADYKCDEMNDCDDESDEDEAICGIKNCTSSGEWMCESGQCIPLSWRCDRNTQCNDGSDEKQCSSNVCSSDRRRCDDGYCIPHSWFCDRQVDCSDGSDERECPCKLGEYRCENGSCLDEEKLCSGIISCGEEKLSLVCSPNSTYSKKVSTQHCELNSIPCDASSSSIRCIPFDAWCNGTTECPNQEDELNCYNPCKQNEARCLDDACIPQSWVCDGQNDCLDESDEKNCVKPIEIIPSSRCSKNEFECSDGTCIHSDRVCDQTSDCTLGEDEYGECDKCSVSKGGCEQICTSNPYSVVCSCKDGFELSSNGHSCNDIDECENIDICDHFCVNLKGTFTCTCQVNYTIQEDGVTCKRNDGAQWSVTAITNKRLMNLNTNLDNIASRSLPKNLIGENVQLLFDPVERRTLAIDAKTGTLHTDMINGWTSDKTNVTNIMATALDYIHRNIYIVKGNMYKGKRAPNGKILSTTVKVYNMKSKTTGTLFDEEKIIEAMVLSLEYQNMFTCENEEEVGGSVVSRNLDGTETNILAHKKMLSCQSLAVDSVKRRVYWVDGALNTIESIGFLGHARRRYSSKKISAPRGLSLLDRSLIWFNTELNVLMKCSLRKPDICSEVSYDSYVTTLSIEPTYNMNIPSACENSPCQHICVQSTRSIPHCICNEGYSYEGGKCNPMQKQEREWFGNKISGDCEDNPCAIGTCEYLSLGFVMCTCPEGYEGSHCEVTVAESTNDRSYQVIITIVVFFLIMGIIFAFVCCYKRKPAKFFNGKRFRFSPSFVLMRDDSSSEPPTPPVIRYNMATNTNTERLTYENSNDSAIVIDALNPNEPLHNVSLSSPASMDPPHTPRAALVSPRSSHKKINYSPFQP